MLSTIWILPRANNRRLFLMGLRRLLFRLTQVQERTQALFLQYGWQAVKPAASFLSLRFLTVVEGGPTTLCCALTTKFRGWSVGIFHVFILQVIQTYPNIGSLRSPHLPRKTRGPFCLKVWRMCSTPVNFHLVTQRGVGQAAISIELLSRCSNYSVFLTL